MIRLLLLLILFLIGLCPLTAAINRTLAPPAPPPDVCSENPAYAKALIAVDWLAQHPSQQPTMGSMMGHAYLDGLYDSVYSRGEVPPVAPPCTVTARVDTPITDRPNGTVIGTLHAGQSADLYGRSENAQWWNINTDGLWGWVSAGSVTVQTGADRDAIPIHD